MISVLLVIIFILLLTLQKKKGIMTFMCLILNFVLILSYIYLIYLGINSYLLSFLLSILACATSLFLLNGFNFKTKASFKSTMVVMIIMFSLIYLVAQNAHITGFTSESREIIGTYSLYINFNMHDLMIAIILISTIGTIIDTSFSISSSVNEIYENNKDITKKDLYNSGINIGKDIINTTINTLYFASISAFIVFIFWNYDLTLLEVINHKMFVQDIFEILILFIASIIVIPITSYFISSKLLKE